MIAVLIPVILLLLSIGILNLLQNKLAKILPEILKTWNFLPEPLRSLEPYDRLITKYLMCCNKKKDSTNTDECVLDDVEKQAYTNVAFTTSL